MMRFAVAFFAALAVALVPALAPAGAASARHTRTWKVALAPAPGDLALAELRAPRRRRPLLTARNTLLSGQGRFGGDYLAVARVRGARGSGQVVLVLAVNRGGAAAAPGATSLALQVPRALGVPATALLSNPFTSASGARVSGPAAARCGLTRSGAALDAASVLAIAARGTPLAGFSAPQAVAAAYDAVCGLSYPSAFKAVVQPPAPPCTQVSGCCPPTAMCVPIPEPPPEPVPLPPGPPRCAPCEPRPGFACPLSATPSICYQAAARGSAEPAGAGSH